MPNGCKKDVGFRGLVGSALLLTGGGPCRNRNLLKDFEA